MPPKKTRKSNAPAAASAPAANLSSMVPGIEEFCTCCRCRQVPREADIVQCTAAKHYMCADCVEELPVKHYVNEMPVKNCPLCPAELLRGNLNRRGMLDRDNLVRFKCCYSDKGCKTTDTKALLKQHEASCPAKNMSYCKYARHGCKKLIKFEQKQEHEPECRFQPVRCLENPWNCKLYNIPVATLHKHIAQEHSRLIPLLEGGGPHEIVFLVRDTALKRKEASLAHVWLRYSVRPVSRNFYVNLSKSKGTQDWLCQVWGDCLIRDGFRASIEAQDPTTGEGVMTFLGPVNPFTTSPTPGRERELLGLSMPNTIVERLRFSEGEDKDCIVVKVHVWKKMQGNNKRCRASDSE